MSNIWSRMCMAQSSSHGAHLSEATTAPVATSTSYTAQLPPPPLSNEELVWVHQAVEYPEENAVSLYGIDRDGVPLCVRVEEVYQRWCFVSKAVEDLTSKDEKSTEQGGGGIIKPKEHPKALQFRNEVSAFMVALGIVNWRTPSKVKRGKYLYPAMMHAKLATSVPGAEEARTQSRHDELRQLYIGVDANKNDEYREVNMVEVVVPDPKMYRYGSDALQYLIEHIHKDVHLSDRKYSPRGVLPHLGASILDMFPMYDSLTEQLLVELRFRGGSWLRVRRHLSSSGNGNGNGNSSSSSNSGGGGGNNHYHGPVRSGSSTTAQAGAKYRELRTTPALLDHLSPQDMVRLNLPLQPGLSMLTLRTWARVTTASVGIVAATTATDDDTLAKRRRMSHGGQGTRIGEGADLENSAAGSSAMEIGFISYSFQANPVVKNRAVQRLNECEGRVVSLQHQTEAKEADEGVASLLQQIEVKEAEMQDHGSMVDIGGSSVISETQMTHAKTAKRQLEERLVAVRNEVAAAKRQLEQQLVAARNDVAAAKRAMPPGNVCVFLTWLTRKPNQSEADYVDQVEQLQTHTRAMNDDPSGPHGQVLVFDSERQMLRHFARDVQIVDPDLMVGWKLGTQLCLIQERIGRLASADLGKLSRLQNNPMDLSKIQARAVIRGRLLCDLSDHIERHLKTEEAECTLSTVAKNESINVHEYQAPTLRCLAQCVNRAAALDQVIPGTLWEHVVLHRAVSTLPVLQLASNIAKVCGCLLQHTLLSTVIPQSAFLLLHTHYASDYVSPTLAMTKRGNHFYNLGLELMEKQLKASAPSLAAAAAANAVLTGTAAVKTAPGKVHGKYQGGLNLPPDLGFYADTFHGCLDVINCYPSMIQQHNLCCCAGTLVALATGISIPIEQVKVGDMVLGLADPKGAGVTPRAVTTVHDNGTRECVELMFSDGRLLTCTPDHKILTAEGDWIEAQHLVVGSSEVIAGPSFPSSDRNADWTSSLEWRIPLREQLGFDLTPSNAEHAMAFARLAGYTMTDGHIVEGHDKGVLYVGHNLDTRTISQDLELLGAKCNPTKDSRGLGIMTLDSRIVSSLKAIGLSSGNRVGQLTNFPSCFTDSGCPLAVVREFLGGLFGGDGTTVSYAHVTETFTPVRFTWTKKGLVARKQLHQFKNELAALLHRCGVQQKELSFFIDNPSACQLTAGGLAEVKNKKAAGEQLGSRVEDDDELDDDRSYKMIASITTKGTLAFAENVGFRHCVHKQMRLSAGCLHARLRSRLELERMSIRVEVERLRRVSKISLPKALFKAKETISEGALLHPQSVRWNPKSESHLAVPTVIAPIKSSEILDAFAVREFFSHSRTGRNYRATLDVSDMIGDRHGGEVAMPLWPSAVIGSGTENQSHESCSKVRYSVPRGNVTLPTFRIRLVATRKTGMLRVFDLSVPTEDPTIEPSFVAGGIVVHNCMTLQPKLGQMLNGWDDDTDDQIAERLRQMFNIQPFVFTAENLLAGIQLAYPDAMATVTPNEDLVLAQKVAARASGVLSLDALQVIIQDCAASRLNDFQLAHAIASMLQLAQKPSVAKFAASMAPLPSKMFEIQTVRRASKAGSKKERARGNTALADALETEQIALKLVLNGTYGNFGNEEFRFAQPRIASMITLLGRDTLLRAVRMCESVGRKPSSGDTDAIMFDTRATTHQEASTLAQVIVNRFNLTYPFIQLEIGNIFRAIAIIKRKNYMAIDVVNEKTMSIVMKSMLWSKSLSCEFASWVCNFVCTHWLLRATMDLGKNFKTLEEDVRKEDADKILAKYVDQIKHNPDGSIQSVVLSTKKPKSKNMATLLVTRQVWTGTPRSQYFADLQCIRDVVTQGQTLIAAKRWDQFVIHQTLNKHLHEYANDDNDHVKVARWLQTQGILVQKDDVIPYIMSIDSTRQQTGEASSHNHVRHRVYPYHPLQVEKANGSLQPSLHWYVKTKIVNELVDIYTVMSLPHPIAEDKLQEGIKLIAPDKRKQLEIFQQACTREVAQAFEAQKDLQ
jgi:DNA polymerase elongation subunit (family B)